MKVKEKVTKILKYNFPVVNIKSAYAYGSAAVPQKDNIGKMIDIFIIVDDLKTFHIENLKINKNHYSFLARNLGIDLLVKINRFGTGVYYNPSISYVVENENVEIKYGVISQIDFERNLENWDNLFVSGRFHKPVVKVVDSDSIDHIDSLIEINRERAVFFIYILISLV